MNKVINYVHGYGVHDEEGNILAWFADEDNAQEWCELTNGKGEFTRIIAPHQVRLGDEF